MCLKLKPCSCPVRKPQVLQASELRVRGRSAVRLRVPCGIKLDTLYALNPEQILSTMSARFGGHSIWQTPHA